MPEPLRKRRPKRDLAVLRKPPNKAQTAEEVEGGRLAERNLLGQNTFRMQSRSNCAPSAFERVHQAAGKGVVIILGDVLALLPEAGVV